MLNLPYIMSHKRTCGCFHSQSINAFEHAWRGNGFTMWKHTHTNTHTHRG